MSTTCDHSTSRARPLRPATRAASSNDGKFRTSSIFIGLLSSAGTKNRRKFVLARRRVPSGRSFRLEGPYSSKGWTRTVQAVTSGNAELARRRAASTPRGVGCVHPISVARASGAKVWDAEGREYLDFVGGIGVLNVGHANPKIVAAIARQAAGFTHLCFQVTSYEPYVGVAKRSTRCAPGTSPKKTLLLSTGAEATENAVKIAREYTGRPAVIAFQHGYHGRTLLALSMTGKERAVQAAFRPVLQRNLSRAVSRRARTDGRRERALEALDEVFATQRLTRSRRGDYHRAGARRRRVHSRPRPRFCARCANSATGTASC